MFSHVILIVTLLYFLYIFCTFLSNFPEISGNFGKFGKFGIFPGFPRPSKTCKSHWTRVILLCKIVQNLCIFVFFLSLFPKIQKTLKIAFLHSLLCIFAENWIFRKSRISCPPEKKFCTKKMSPRLRWHFDDTFVQKHNFSAKGPYSPPGGVGGLQV